MAAELSVVGSTEELLVAAAGRRGEGRDGAIEAPVVTAFMLDGRMLRAGSDGGDEPAAGAGGGGICCEDVRRDMARTRGDSGTVFRSGILLKIV